MTHRARFLVGPNNAGKTSLLRILDWSINHADVALLTDGRGLSDQEALLCSQQRTPPVALGVFPYTSVSATCV